MTFNANANSSTMTLLRQQQQQRSREILLLTCARDVAAAVFSRLISSLLVGQLTSNSPEINFMFHRLYSTPYNTGHRDADETKQTTQEDKQFESYRTQICTVQSSN